jgi:hypothetical protein
MYAVLYVTAEHKISCSGGAIGTIEHRDIHNGCSTVLTEFRSVIVWLFLCVAECNGDRHPQYKIRNLAGCVNVNPIFHYKHHIGTSS